MSAQAELRRRITEKIVSSLAQGCPPWKRPWSFPGDAGLPANVVSRRNYTGINTMLLSAISQERGYRSRWWGTFNQWTALGGQVRRRPDDIAPGEWACRIVYCREVSRTQTNAVTEDDEQTFRLLKWYWVFNADQVDGLPESLRPTATPRPVIPDYGPAEEAIRATAADIRYGGTRAFYNRTGDFICIPPRETFVGAHEWYATHCHELGHWAEKRVGWSGSYALGELAAEIAACYLCAELSIPQSDDLTNHEAYLASWLRELENDHGAIFRAAAQASRTSDHILSYSRQADIGTETSTALA